MKKLAVILGVLLAVMAAQASAIDVEPSVSISPAPGTTVNSTVTITAVAVDIMDNAGLNDIKIYEDGILKKTHECHGTTTCTATKAFSYTTEQTHSYYAVAKDLGGHTKTSDTITVNFLGPNTPPKWVGLPKTLEILEDSGENQNLINLRSFAQDNQTSPDELTYTILSQTNAALADCAIDSNDNLDCTVIAANESGTSTVNLEVSDSQLADNKTIDIWVRAVNDPPYLVQQLPSITLAEDTYYDLLNLSDYFADIDGSINGPPLMIYSFNSNPDVSAESTEINPNTELLNLTGTNNYTGIFTLTITASDSINSTSANAVVNVTPVNDAPVLAQPLPDINVPEDSYDNSLNLNDYFADIDSVLALAITGNNSNVSVEADLTNSTETLLLINATNNYSGSFNLTINATDGEYNLSDIMIVNITPVNDAPYLNQTLPNITLAEDTYYDLLNLSDYFADIDGPANISYSFSSNPNVTAGSAKINPYTALLNLSAINNYTGLFTLTITASDGLNTTNETALVNVTPVNDAPVLVLEDQSANVGELFTYHINATDIDDIAEVFTFFDNTTLFDINKSTGLINFTALTFGNYSINISACDSSGEANNCTSAEWNLTLTDNMPPVIASTTAPAHPVVYSENATYEFTINLLDFSGIGKADFHLNGQNVSGVTGVNSSLFTANLTLPAGNHTYQWRFADIFNNSNSSEVYNFTVLKANTSINLTINGVDGNITFPITSYDNNMISLYGELMLPPNATVYIGCDNSTSNASGPSPLNFTANWDDEMNGLLFCTASYYGNQNYSSSQDLHWIEFIDQLVPRHIQSEVSPASPAGYSENAVYSFKTDWRDNWNIDAVLLEFNGINQTSADLLTGEYEVNITGLPIGNYTYKWHANDTSGNTNTTSDYNYEITAGTPALAIAITPSDTVAYGTAATINCTAPTAQVALQLYRNGTLVSNPDTAALAAGSYNYTCISTASQNYTSASAQANLTVNKAAGQVNLLLNSIDNDLNVLENSTVNITGLLTAGVGDIQLYVNGTLINSGSSPLTNLTDFNLTGVYPVLVNFTGSENHTSASETHTLIVGGGALKSNFTPSSGSLLNQSYAAFSIDTNQGTSCRWDFSDNDYDLMQYNFTTTGGTSHSTQISPFNLGLNTFSVGCENDTVSTNIDFTYNVTNIIENSSIDNATIENSIVRYANISPSTSIADSTLYYDTIVNADLVNVTANNSKINDSILSHCQILNSTVKDIIASNCHFANSFVDPSNLTGSNISDSDITNSNATYSNITGSIITDSNVDLSEISNATIKNNSIVLNSSVSASTLANNKLANATIANNSILTNVNGTNIVVSDNILLSGNVTVVTGGVQYNVSAVANLSEYVEVPPTASFTLNPGSSIYDGNSITFTSTSTDVNIGTAINDSITLLWQFSDGTNSTNTTVAKTYPNTGTYPFNLTATDKFGESSTASGSISVSTFSSQGGRRGGGGGGGGHGFPGFSRVIKVNLSENKTVVHAVTHLDAVLLEHEGVSYTMENFRISREGVNFTITGRPHNFINNEVRKINLDNDKYYDLTLQFTRNFVTRAEFMFIPKHELVPGFMPGPARQVVIPEPEEDELEETRPEQQQAEAEEVEEKVQEEPEAGQAWLAGIWQSVKNAFGKQGVVLDFGSAKWLITLAVIVFGLLAYAVISRLIE